MSWCLWPLSKLFQLLVGLRRLTQRAAQPLPVPVLVVGNLVVGGAGKTPTVMAVVQALQAAGHRPGIISRGHGRQGDAVREVQAADSAAQVGDEPLLMRRRCAVPVWVGRQRAQAALALCAAHPEVDVLVSDDGLQHHALARDAELVVFDERGAGNGLLLPAGPLREALPQATAQHQRVLYTHGQASTALAGAMASRRLGQAWPLSAWAVGLSSAAVPLQSLHGRRGPDGRLLLAVAGIAAPQKFFGMLQAAGLSVEPCPVPDHHAYAALPWPADTADVITTEKDAIKLATLPAAGIGQGTGTGRTRIWVVPLDLQLPAALVADLLTLLFPNRTP